MSQQNLQKIGVFTASLPQSEPQDMAGWMDVSTSSKGSRCCINISAIAVATRMCSKKGIHDAFSGE
ncbi:hypothetical protein E2C01_027672 [Portunus trituberculatus]|uniref:Uncharacterized protein n=1 Tax=Portunus trituberculatus TaxID=210409 RepID=A0A5B7ELT0_PORTR|nr:hypothetical protein [Portunus trituberculatus]